MFSRGIRGISVENNISAVAVKEEVFSHSPSLARQLLSFENLPTTALLATPAGEITTLSPSHEPTELSKLTVCGVCMNGTGAKIYKKLLRSHIDVVCVSLCDIAASFFINSNDCERAVNLIREDFTLEL